MTMKTKVGASLLIAGAAVGLQPVAAVASSHREAPMIAEDPTADNTDLWAFTSPDMPNTVTIIAGYIGLEEPGGGPNWAKFSDDVLYEIKIDNSQSGNPNNIVFQFRFTTSYNPALTTGAGGTFFNTVGQVDGLPTATAFHNTTVVQTMNVWRIDNGAAPVHIGVDLPVAPTYSGRFGYGTGGNVATDDSNYTNIANMAVSPLTGGNGRVFAGPRDDPFFADLGSIFDDVTFRSSVAGFGSQGGGFDILGGYNVHVIALQVPVDHLVAAGTSSSFTDVHNVIGMYATASRPRITIRRDCSSIIAPHARPLPTGYVRHCEEEGHGQWVQVSRLGIPLVNEVLIPLAEKDWWNRAPVTQDVANFGSYLLIPSLPTYAQVLYGPMGLRAHAGYVAPTRSAAAADIPDNDMFKLVTGQVGISGVNAGRGMGLPPADLLRLNVRTPATALPTNVGNPTTLAAGASRLGAAGGDTNGFPNGRRLFDDVVDIEERYVLNGLAHLNMIPFGDGVDGNDVVYQTTFPYVPIPRPGDALVVHHMEATRAAP